MAKKIFKLVMLSTLLFFGLGLTLASCTVSNNPNVDEEPEPSEPSEPSEPEEPEEEFIDLNDHTHDGWTSLSQSDFDSGDYSSGNLTGGTTEDEMIYYYLNQDITLTSNDITVSNYVTLCLNSYTIKGTGSTQVINVSTSSYFNLCECNTEKEGVITNGTTNGIYVSNGATFNMYGGSISENSCSTINFGGGVNVDSATFNMYGGSISYNQGERNGGGVYVDGSDATFNMYNGSINNNTAGTAGTSYYAGGVFVRYATFNMYGGSISNNQAPAAGGIYMYGADATFYMYDGTITENSATRTDNNSLGGGVHISASTTFKMYGGTISNNTANYRGSGVYIRSPESNFYMYGGTITDNDSTYGVYSLYAAPFYMYGGYLNDGLSLGYGAPSHIYGGYISNAAYSSISNYLATDRIRVDISAIGTAFDEAYQEEYPNAIYADYSLSTEVINIDTTYGSIYSIDIGVDYTNLTYTLDNNGETTILENNPTYLGTYDITAHLLLETTNDDITTKYYGARTIALTISKGQALISLNSISKVYDGEAANIDYIATVGDLYITDEAKVTWYDEEGEEIEAPVAVGIYKATISVAGTDLYDGTSINVNYTITEN